MRNDSTHKDKPSLTAEELIDHAIPVIHTNGARDEGLPVRGFR